MHVCVRAPATTDAVMPRFGIQVGGFPKMPLRKCITDAFVPLVLTMKVREFSKMLLQRFLGLHCSQSHVATGSVGDNIYCSCYSVMR